MSLRNATMTLALLVRPQIPEEFRPVGFVRAPNKSKRAQLWPPSLRQSFLVFALALPKDPLPEAKAIFFMSGRNTTMTFALLVHPQIPEAFRPVGFERVPNKSKLVELLSPSLRQSFFVLAPIIHPLAETKAVLLVALWDTAVTLTLLVHRQILEAFRPVGFERVPLETDVV